MTPDYDLDLPYERRALLEQCSPAFQAKEKARIRAEQAEATRSEAQEYTAQKKRERIGNLANGFFVSIIISLQLGVIAAIIYVVVKFLKWAWLH